MRAKTFVILIYNLLRDNFLFLGLSYRSFKGVYRNASFIANNRVVFNIKRNKYRLVVVCFRKIDMNAWQKYRFDGAILSVG
jgi:hypothetical protein